MPLDPQAQQLLDQNTLSGLLPVYTLPVEQARARMTAAFASSSDPEPVGRIENIVITTPDGIKIPLRVYSPDKEIRGIVLFLHGGGWVLNNIDTHDGICRNLTRLSGWVTVSVDFRLAPEHPFPAAIEDCLAALKWTIGNSTHLGSTPDRIVVAGDSSGGNLATVITQLAYAQEQTSLAGQILIYPVTDYLIPGTDSYREFAKGYSLDRDFMEWFWNHYLPQGTDPYQARLSPLRADDLSHLPPTLVLTAEFDPLRDEGEAYARRLQDAGVTTQLSRYDGMMHGFLIQYDRLDKGRFALEEISSWLRSLLA